MFENSLHVILSLGFIRAGKLSIALRFALYLDLGGEEKSIRERLTVNCEVLALSIHICLT